VLIAAAIALSAISETEESANQRGSEYEDASDYKAAAIASIATSSIAITFHVSMIILRCIYLFSAEEKFFRLYAIIVSITTRDVANNTPLEYINICTYCLLCMIITIYRICMSNHSRGKTFAVHH